MARQANIKLRRSASAGAIPTTSNLDLGELALNTVDGKLYMKTTEGSLDSVIQVGSASDSYFKIRKSDTQTFTVKVVTKTADHAYYGSGSSSGYNINGIESPHLMLVPGNTYKFDQSDSSNSGHPLRFYYEADKTTAYTTGVTTSGSPGSSGAYTQIIPTGDTPMCLYYQCSAHGYMGNKSSFMTRNFTGFDTDDLSEGSTNQYHTTARARASISAGGDLSYNSSTGVMSYTTPTMYANSDARQAISVTDSGGDGSLAYNNSTGVITYVGPSAAEVRAHISAGTGVAISNGAISIGQAVGTSDNVTFGNIAGTLTTAAQTNITSVGTLTSLTVSGNLTVSGTTTTVNSATLDVADKNITINKGSGDTSGTADGAGITIQDAVNASTDATLLWDATNDRFDFSHPLEITNNGTTDTLLLTSTEASSSAAPVLTFKRNSGSPADADYLGQLKFKGENDADQETVFAKITAKVQDASDGSEDGILEFANVKAGSNTITARLRSDSLQLLNGTSLVVAGLTYPTSDGSSGQALVTDGSGNLSFSSISAGGNAFGTIAVSGQSNVAADSNSDTLTLVAGSNITITTAAGTDTITIAASGGGSAITVQDEGSALSTAAGTINFVGAGVTATGTGSTKTITIPGTGTVSEAFKTLAVSGQTSVVADGATDTLTLAAGSGMTITTNASTDTITFASSGGGGSASASDIRTKYVYTTTGSTTAFSGSDDNSATLSYTLGAVDVYLNGVLQKLTTDYAETNTSTITFVNAIASGNVVEIIAYYKTIGTGNSVVNQFTGNGSTTAYTVTTAPESENNLLVYIDGVYQQKTDYTVSGTTLTMDTAPANGAIIETVCSVGAITAQADLTLTGELDSATLDVSGNAAIGGNLSLDGSNKELRFYEGSNYVGFEAPALTADQIWVLPTADGSSGHALKTDGSGTLSWGTAGGNAFDKVAVSGQTNIVADSTTDTLTFAAGAGITLTTTPGTDTLTITNSSLGANAFGTVAISGQTSVAADSTADTLTLEAGAGIVLTTDASNDKVTIAGGSGSVFTTDLFTASGSGSALLAYTLSTTPSSENELICFIEGVYQNKNSYTLSGTTLTFDSGIVSGQEIVVHHVGAGVVGVSPTIDTFTGNGSAHSYTLSVAPPNENYIQVYWDGVYQHHDQYTVSGTTLAFGGSNIPPASTAIEVHIPSVNGIGTPSNATVTPAKLSTGAPSWDTNSNLIIGNSYIRSDSTSVSSTSATTVATHAVATYRSVNYNVQITQGTDYHMTSINVIHDGTTAYMTEYGAVFDNASLATFDATISSGNLLLQVTMGSNSSSTIKVMSTAITV